MKKRTLFCWAIYTLFLFFASSLYAAPAMEAVILTINGAIGPATQDYIQRGIEQAETEKANVIIIELDTPGGLDASMRGIDHSILNANLPVITYVAPTGARAASAGTYILYASHVAAMAPGTNLGAATPVAMGTEEPTPGLEKEKNAIHEKNLSALERKSLNDAVAYIQSLATLRGRNGEWAADAVKYGMSLPAEEALKRHVINVIANDISDLLHKVNGMTVNVKSNNQTLHTDNLSVTTITPDWRYQFLSIITDPNIAYILLLIGFYGLFFEFYNPGFVLPGVAGAICLLLALYAFQLLPINYVGFALLLLGLSFMIVEIMVSSFGILGIGGVIAFITGSILLLDMHSPGYHIAWSLIIMMTVFSTAFFFLVVGLALRAMRRKIVSGKEALIGMEGEVIEIHQDHTLLVRIQGELWKAHAGCELHTGDKIKVREIHGLDLTVEPILKKAF